jgi:acylphosphatase
MVTICRRCLVDGKVQGVFFRASTYKEALRIDVTGWVRNLEDGRVEVCMQGHPGKVEAMEDWLWVGSPMSRVSSVQCRDETGCRYENFSVTR